VFLFCWVPFFTINISNAVCIRYDLFDVSAICRIDPILFSLLTWLGYVNSFLNPVIYTIFSNEFLTVPDTDRHTRLDLTRPHTDPRCLSLVHGSASWTSDVLDPHEQFSQPGDLHYL